MSKPARIGFQRLRWSFMGSLPSSDVLSLADTRRSPLSDAGHPKPAISVYKEAVTLLRPIPNDALRRAAATPREPSEAEVLRLTADGSDVAFRALWARYGAAVYAVCRRVLGDAGAAEDAAQEAFVRIWRGADRFDPRRGSAAAWMCTIARNAALNIARVQNPSPVAEIDPGAHHDGDLVEQFWLQGTLTRLSHDERTVIELAYFTDLSHSQVAAYLDQPLGTVKARIRRAIGRLADLANQTSTDPTGFQPARVVTLKAGGVPVHARLALGRPSGSTQPLRLVAEGLPPGPVGSYALWLVGPDGSVLLRSFRPNSVGSCIVDATAPPGRWTRVVITRGSQPPTSDGTIASASL
jgi:RNA polymerase sigma-70 factor (ECF subfamily)